MFQLTNVADLHVHTNASDGACTLAEVSDMARKADVEIIAVTDHDSVGALTEPYDHLAVEIIPGVELSGALGEREAHILGYFIDVENKRLRSQLVLLQEKRRTRLDSILAKLSDIDIDIDPEMLSELAEDCAVGRLHVAEMLIQQGHAGSVYEAFRDFLGTEGKAFVAKARLSVGDAIALIHECGGAAVLAHPGGFFINEEVEGMAAEGLDGVEAYYPSHSPTDTEHWVDLCKRLDLVVTGGSDFHGRSISGTPLGSARVSRREVDILRERSAGHAPGRVL